MNIAGIMQKKVVGVPVIYLAGGGAVILAVVAYRMQSTQAASDDNAGVDATEGDDGDGSIAGEKATDPYASYRTDGTVTTVTPMPSEAGQTPVPDTNNDSWLRDAVKKLTEDDPNIAPTDAQKALNNYLDGKPPTAAEKKIVNEAIKKIGQPPNIPIEDDPEPEKTKTNTEWARDGASWAIATLGVSGSTAQLALEKYLQGQNRSYEEQTIVDAVIKAKGLPPDSINTGGTVGAKAAQKQFTAFPGVHRIKNDSDNGYPQIAKLYYNRSDTATINLLRGENPALGANGPWATGTAVKVPKYTVPKWFKATKDIRSEYQIAKKNGISINQLKALNPGMAFPAKVGTNVRVD